MDGILETSQTKTIFCFSSGLKKESVKSKPKTWFLRSIRHFSKWRKLSFWSKRPKTGGARGGRSFFFIVAPADEKHTVCKTLTVVGERELAAFTIPFFFFPSTTHWSTKLTYPIPIYIGKPLHLKIHCDGMGVVIATGFGFLCTRCIKALTAVISVFDGSPPPPSAIAVCCIWQKWPLKWLQEAVSGVVLTV